MFGKSDAFVVGAPSRFGTVGSYVGEEYLYRLNQHEVALRLIIATHEFESEPAGARLAQDVE
jgi:hypothetical protein